MKKLFFLGVSMVLLSGCFFSEKPQEDTDKEIPVSLENTGSLSDTGSLADIGTLSTDQILPPPASQRLSEFTPDKTSGYDNATYPEKSFATYIQKNPEARELFKGSKLNEEFCFLEEQEDAKLVTCTIPSQEGAENFTNLFSYLKNKKRVAGSLVVQDKLGLGTLLQSYLPAKQFLQDKYAQGILAKGEAILYAYSFGLEGEYAAYADINTKLCEQYSINCAQETIFVRGTVFKSDGTPLEKAKIELISDLSYPSTFSDEQGNFVLKFSSHLFEKVRFRASKKGFSDGFVNINIQTSKGGARISDIDFYLETPIKHVTLYTDTMKYVGEGVSVKNADFLVTTPYNLYTIPNNVFLTEGGKPYTGHIDAFFFEFDKDSQFSLLENDTFDDVVGYAGNILKTFGMPYALFLDTDGNRLHVYKSSPIVLQSKIMEMEALRTNQDGIYWELTDADMKKLIAVSQKYPETYPITRDFLIDPENLMVHFPAFWIFDQKKGIWENIGLRLLNTDGLAEMLYYTYNDIK